VFYDYMYFNLDENHLPKGTDYTCRTCLLQDSGLPVSPDTIDEHSDLELLQRPNKDPYTVNNASSQSSSSSKDKSSSHVLPSAGSGCIASILFCTSSRTLTHRCSLKRKLIVRQKPSRPG